MSLKTRTLRTGRWMLVAACAAACHSESVGAPQGQLAGIYVLRSVNGTPLPASGNGAGMTQFSIVADTLRLYESGDGVDAMVLSRPGGAAVERETSRFRLRSAGQGFTVEYECADGGSFASCIAAPHHVGRFTTTGLTFETSVLYRTPLVYERIGDGLRWADAFLFRAASRGATVRHDARSRDESGR